MRRQFAARQALIVVLLVLMMFPALVPAVVVPLPAVPVLAVPVLALISVAVGNRRLRVHNRRFPIHDWRPLVHDRSRFEDDGWRRFIHRNVPRRTAAILRGEIARMTRPPRSHLRSSEIPGRCSAVIERSGRRMPGDLSTGNGGSARRSRR